MTLSTLDFMTLNFSCISLNTELSVGLNNAPGLTGPSGSAHSFECEFAHRLLGDLSL